LAHQQDDIVVQKMLLAYSFMVEDKQDGLPIFAAIVDASDPDKNPELIKQHTADFRRLFLMTAMRYMDDADDKSTKESEKNMESEVKASEILNP